MTLSLVATAGSASANTYATLADSETYHESVVSTHISGWSAALDARKNEALVWATRILDKVCDWTGHKATTTQALRWPRLNVYDEENHAVDSTTIPQFLIDATSEFARYLVDADQTAAPSGQGIERVQAGSVEVVFDPSTGAASIPASVKMLLMGYVKEYRDPKAPSSTVELMRA